MQVFSTFYALVHLFEGPTDAFLEAGNNGRSGFFLPELVESVSFCRQTHLVYLFSLVGKLPDDYEIHVFIHTYKPPLSV